MRPLVVGTDFPDVAAFAAGHDILSYHWASAQTPYQMRGLEVAMLDTFFTARFLDLPESARRPVMAELLLVWRVGV